MTGESGERRRDEPKPTPCARAQVPFCTAKRARKHSAGRTIKQTSDAVIGKIFRGDEPQGARFRRLNMIIGVCGPCATTK
eukprot:scaffold17883_cov36-Tisochrysis_lutea.AAC.1